MALTHGSEQAAAWARTQSAKPAVLAATLLELAKAALRDAPLVASTLGAEAIDLDPAEPRVKTLAFQMADLGHIRQAVALINKAVVAGAPFSHSEARKTDHLRSLARLLESPPVVPAPGHGSGAIPGRRIALIGRQAVPFHVSSAALRLAGRARQIEALGWDVTMLTPPGYPFDGRDRLLANQQPAPSSAGPRHIRLEPTEHSEDVVDLYLPAAAERIAAAAVAMGASIIQADGYFINGVAAALAARLTGKPLVLEFDAFWDPHAPFPHGYERTEKGQMELWMSLIAARAADVCVVSSPALVEVLAGAGVDPSRITIVPHRPPVGHPDPAARSKLARDLGLDNGPVIGVVRDLCESYDTTVLADVMAGLVARHPALKLLVVGYGRMGAALRHHVAKHRLGDRLVLIEQPAADHMALYRSLLDVAIFTRNETLKAAMIAPYEVSAAMAAGTAVAAYATPDAADVIEDGVTGLLCNPASVDELIAKVHGLLSDAALRARLGAAAQHAALGASANVADQELSGFYARLLAPGQRARQPADVAAS